MERRKVRPTGPDPAYAGRPVRPVGPMNYRTEIVIGGVRCPIGERGVLMAPYLLATMKFGTRKNNV